MTGFFRGEGMMMRGFKRALAVSGVALAAFGLAGAAPAVAGQAGVQANCATDTDGHTWAWAYCNTTGEYRVVVDYCRASCSREYGPWVRQPEFSRLDGYPAGGSIVVQAPQIR